MGVAHKEEGGKVVKMEVCATPIPTPTTHYCGPTTLSHIPREHCWQRCLHASPTPQTVNPTTDIRRTTRLAPHHRPFGPIQFGPPSCLATIVARALDRKYSSIDYSPWTLQAEGMSHLGRQRRTRRGHAISNRGTQYTDSS